MNKIEFTEEQVTRAWMRAQCRAFPGIDQFEATLTRELNAELSEMLAAAPKVGHVCRSRYQCHHEDGLAMWSTPKKFDTHRARLVEIEEIRK